MLDRYGGTLEMLFEFAPTRQGAEGVRDLRPVYLLPPTIQVLNPLVIKARQEPRRRLTVGTERQRHC
jgi:hypothetical protein